MTSILINGLTHSYKYFLETLQIIDKLENQSFDSLGDLFVQHENTFGKKKNLGEDLLFTNSRQGEISRGRGEYNVSTRGRGTYNESTRGRGSYNEKYRERGRFNELINLDYGRGCARSQGRGRNQQYFRRSQDQSQKGEDMSQVKCKIYLHIGHVVEECRTRNENFPKDKQTFKQHSKSNASTLA